MKMLIAAAMVIGSAGCAAPPYPPDPSRGPAPISTPAWSIDRARVLFSGRREGSQELYLLDRASGETRRLTNASAAGDGANAGRISPDGRRVAFQTRSGRNYEIYLLEFSGGPAENLSNHPEYDVSPTWSPDGRRIAFMSTRGFELGGIGPFPGHVYILDLESGELRQVTSQPLTSSLGPSDWSADGGSLLLARIIDGAPELFLLDLLSGRERRLTQTPEGEYSAVFSHDGSRIAFHSESDGGAQIVIMDLVDGSRRALTAGPGYRYNPRWSPGDSWILFTASEVGEQYDLQAVRVADGAIIDLLTTPEDEREGDWLPAY